VWLELQSELLDLSTDATQLVAPDATHQIDWDAPELAIDAVLRVVRAARRGTRMAAAPSAGGAGHQLLEHWDRYLETINAKALDRLMEFFSADAILMPPSQPAVYGVDGARAWFGALFAEFDVELAMPTLELMLLGDRAVRRGTYEVSLTPNAGGPRSVDRGKFIQVWERQGEGVWRIVRGMLNSDLPTIETVGRE
jgi:ketosteroid isomerase-like protein